MTDPRRRFPADDPPADESVARLVRGAAPQGFAPGFRQRVLTRAGWHDMPLVTALERQFLRIVPLAAAVTILLAGYNWWGSRRTSATPLDAALALPGISLAAAYAPAQLFGVTIASVENP